MSPYSRSSDEELFSFLREGRKEVYAEVYDRFKGLLYIHAYKMLQDEEEAKDAVQDVFAALWTKRDQLHVKTKLSAYLYSAIRNRVLDHIAHKQVEDRYVDSLQYYIRQYGTEVADHALREKELKATIEREIDALPEKMRAIFVLSREGDFSHKEIAAQLNISEKTVKKQINNALKVLRVKLDHFGIFLFF